MQNFTCKYLNVYKHFVKISIYSFAFFFKKNTLIFDFTNFTMHFFIGLMNKNTTAYSYFIS
ncbi:hypothetical protein BJ944DRAFT_108682 [Cunninghamella echinulata]|nr:hypothetical protein BJ944DRAFT_108682 [Cunninghamella echinulata]